MNSDRVLKKNLFSGLSVSKSLSLKQSFFSQTLLSKHKNFNKSPEKSEQNNLISRYNLNLMHEFSQIECHFVI